MKITDVEALHLRLPDVEEIADGTQDVLVIRIHTDAGLVGIGEVSSQSYVCKAIFEAPRSAERRHGLAYLLRGQDPLNVEAAFERIRTSGTASKRRTRGRRCSAQTPSLRSGSRSGNQKAHTWRPRDADRNSAPQP